MINDTGMKFEKMQPYGSTSLVAVREPKTRATIGYVQLILDVGWVWYSSALFSKGFNTYDDAMDDLIRNYVIGSMDQTAKNTGVYNDERYTKGR
jgi:hypothetical protein